MVPFFNGRCTKRVSQFSSKMLSKGEGLDLEADFSPTV